MPDLESPVIRITKRFHLAYLPGKGTTLHKITKEGEKLAYGSSDAQRDLLECAFEEDDIYFDKGCLEFLARQGGGCGIITFMPLADEPSEKVKQENRIYSIIKSVGRLFRQY